MKKSDVFKARAFRLAITANTFLAMAIAAGAGRKFR